MPPRRRRTHRFLPALSARDLLTIASVLAGALGSCQAAQHGTAHEVGRVEADQSVTNGALASRIGDLEREVARLEAQQHTPHRPASPAAPKKPSFLWRLFFMKGDS